MDTLVRIIFLALVSLVARASCSSEQQSISDDTLDIPRRVKFQFESFLEKYNKRYSSPREMNERLRIFANNLKKYEEMNKADRGTAVHGIDQFSDLSVEEFHAKMQSFDPEAHTNVYDSEVYDGPELEGKVPKSFDWREKNVVTPVKDDYSCDGGGWAFATAGNIEALYAIKHKKLVPLSEQQLLSCDTSSSRCTKGTIANAVKYLIKAGGIQDAASYPFTKYYQTEGCIFNKTAVVAKIKALKTLPKNEKKILNYLYHHGPVAAAIDKKGLHGYQRGIAHPPEHICSKKFENANHGVLIVGYGEEVTEENGKKIQLPYWIIKNNNGPWFGVQGYYYLYRGDGSCGINLFASSAVLA